MSGDSTTGQVMTLLIAQLRRDGGTQPRGGIDADTVSRYAQMRREGRSPPAVVVFYDGEHYWLADGFHRVAGSLEAGFSDQPAEVRQGTQRDAIFYSLGANAYHGLALSKGDRQRAAIRLLLDEEWSQLSSRAIAQHVGFRSKTSVTNLRARLQRQGHLGPVTEIKGTDGKTYPIPVTEEPEGEADEETDEDIEEEDGAPEAVPNPFPEGCKTGDERVAYADTLSSVAEIEKLLAWPELQKSAANKIEYRRKKLLRVESAGREDVVSCSLDTLPYRWPEEADPSLEAAILARLESLADGAVVLGEGTDAEQIERVRALSEKDGVEVGLLEAGLSPAVRRALLLQCRLLDKVRAYYRPDEDTPPGVLVAYERKEAVRQAQEAEREARRAWLSASSNLGGDEALDRIAETADADLLASWYTRETANWVKDNRFYEAGRDEIRCALWTRLVELEVRPADAEECPACVGCFALASHPTAEARCPHCSRSPTRVRVELAQLARVQAAANGEPEPASILTLADRVEVASEPEVQAIVRKTLPQYAEHDSVRLLCEGDEGLVDLLPDMGLHELRELYYLGRAGDPNRVLLRAVEEALAAAEAEAAAVLAPTAGVGDRGPGPGPMVQDEDEDGLPALIRSRVHQGALGFWLCRERPEPEVFHSQLSHVEDTGDIEEALAVAWWLRLPLVYTDLLWARHAELAGEGGSAVAWPTEATAAGKVSVVELLCALDEATGHGPPPAWLEQAPPTLATALMAWMANECPRPVLPVRDAEAAK